MVPALARWHRRAGIASAVIVVWLVLTGVLLVHADDLALDEGHVGTRWLLDWYGIGAPEPIVAYRVGTAWVTLMGQRIYFDERPLAGERESLGGAVAFGDEVVVAAGDDLVVLTRQGDTVEVLDAAHGVPRRIRNVAARGQQLIVRAADGDFLAEEGLHAWQPYRGPEAEWARHADLPPALRQRLIEHYRGNILTLERLLRDLHSGRLLGGIGTAVVDLAALAFLALAVSGLWLWVLGTRRTRRGGRP